MNIREGTHQIEKIVTAIDAIRFGSVDITIHDSRIVQIEIREKIRFEKDNLLKFPAEISTISVVKESSTIIRNLPVNRRIPDPQRRP